VRKARFDELDRNWQPVRIRDDPDILAVYTDWSPKEFFVQVLNKSEEPLTQLVLAVNVNGAGFAIPKEIEFPQERHATSSSPFVSSPSSSAQAEAHSNWTSH
jgi:hypothetical protein